ncbi:MAG TPA: hypothetical protein PK924_05120 [Bacilli bacterium]|nr:hypothetical protein [Bacilli bacterium]
MTKEQFIKRMELIQNFHSEQETLQVLINKLTDGYSVVDMGNYLVDELVNIITEELHIKDKDLLYWWLYEDIEKIIYDADEKPLYNVETLDGLYDYIIKEYGGSI